VNVTTKLTWYGSRPFVPLNSGAQRFRELARFLVDGAVSDGVNVLGPAPAPASRPTLPRHRRGAVYFQPP
jgi:hypothetical protein